MPKVELPMADWNVILLNLEILAEKGYFLRSLIQDIDAQLSRQEY